MIIQNFDLSLPLPTIFPSGWKTQMAPCDFVSFRNLTHFKFVVSKLSQKEADKCGVNYRKAVDDLMRGVPRLTTTEQESIRNLVRSKLHKRGLITGEVYENYRYTADGTVVGIDVGKYNNGEPDCVISPSVQYVDFFYELYISISYPYHIENAKVQENVAKLLATIEELERQHIFIKITLVFPANDISKNKKFFSSIPLFSHKDPKSVEVMSSVVSERLLRKFYFAILEDLYGEELSINYGRAVTLEGVMNIGDTFDEIKFFESIVNAVGA